MPNFVFHNGRIVPYSEVKFGVLTHALNYGTAVFGGLRAYWNEDEKQLFVFRPRDHFRRFLQSAKLLCMELQTNGDNLLKGLVEPIRTEGHEEDLYIRPLAFYSDEIIGVRLHDLTAEVSIVVMPFGAYNKNEENMHVTVSSWRRIDDNSLPARGKIAGAYVNSAFVKTDAVRAGFDEAIVLNADGHISEGSAANFFMLRNGVLATPPITANVLEGITRRTVMRLVRDEFKIEVQEREIDRTELYLADEAFYCGTGAQISAITAVDHRPIGTGKLGDVTSRLRKIYFDVVRGKVAKYRDWCHPVYEVNQKRTSKERTHVTVE
ncbi:MAG: branched chain amino acid aminotransferase [Acidobacteria bacterium]|nr:MAG: branched chain amino acid aminotransferase [Acidobacteriota bacterium]